MGLASEAWVHILAFTAQATTSELPGPSRDHPVTCHRDACWGCMRGTQGQWSTWAVTGEL